MNRKKRKEAGAIAIEAVLSLTIFMLAILALMMGSLLIRAQASMQYALNQTAKEISGYFYLLDKFGIASAVSGNATLSAQAKVQPLNDSIGEIVAFTGNVKKTSGEYKQIVENAKNGNLTDEEIERIKNLPDDATTLKNEAKEIAGHLKDLTDDPKRLFSGVFQVFGKAMINTALSKYVTPFVCEALMPKYLTLNKNSSAFYENTGIIESSIDFDGSQMLADGRTISLVVTYEVDASKLTLGFYKKHLKFQQIASTCAWIRGNDSESLYSLEQVNQLFQEGRIKAEADRRRALNEKEKAEEEERKKKEAEYSSELDEHKADETSKPEKEEEEKKEESSDSEVSSEDIKKFLEQHPECQELYDNYGADVIKAVNNCSDPNAAITLLLNAEKGKPAYGKEALEAINKSGDDAVAALNLVPTKECAVAITRCKDSSAAEAIVAVGKDRANEAVDAIIKGEDPQGVADAIKDLKGDALDVFKKVEPSKACTDALKEGKFDAALVLYVYTDNGLQLYKNGLTTEQILTLESRGLTPDVFAKTTRHVDNYDEAKYLIQQYEDIHKQFSDAEIKKLEERTMAQYKKWKDNYNSKDPAVKAEGKTNNQIGPAVAGVYWQGHEDEDPFFGSNSLRPSEYEKYLKSLSPKERQKQPPYPALNDPDREYYIKNDLAAVPFPCDDRVKAAIESIPDNVEYDNSKGAGSHAEIYAVNEALLAGAKPEELLVYVNHPRSSYDPMVTCPHCESILKQLGVKVISNTEIKDPKDY